MIHASCIVFTTTAIIMIIMIIIIIIIIIKMIMMREGVSGHLPANPPLPLDHCTWNALFTMMMTIVIMIMMIMIPLDHWNTTAHSPYNAIMMMMKHLMQCQQC